MTKRSLSTFLATTFLALLLPLTAMASSEGGLEPSYADIGNRASLQRGAALYMNYGAGCHSLQYQRYSRIAEDLGLSEEQVTANLIFTGAKAGETVKVAMDAGDAEAWFAKTPPDLSKFLLSPMPGLLVRLTATVGQELKAGEEIAVIEAMKMENSLRATDDVTIARVLVQQGQSLVVDQPIVEFG